MDDLVDICMGNLKIINSYNMFFLKHSKNQIDHRAGEMHFFEHWVTRLPIEINVHVANILWQVPQMPAFCLLASSLEVLNLKCVTLTRAASQPVTLF